MTENIAKVLQLGAERMKRVVEAKNKMDGIFKHLRESDLVYKSAKEAYMSGESDFDVIDFIKQRNERLSEVKDVAAENFAKIAENNRIKAERLAKDRLSNNKNVLRNYRIKS